MTDERLTDEPEADGSVDASASSLEPGSVRVDVVIDDDWFLMLPLELAGAAGDAQVDWARAAVDAREPSLEPDERELVEAALADSFGQLSEGSVAALRLVRDGLPGSVLVQVFAQFAELDSLDELDDEAPAALPRQLLPLEIKGSADARIISTVRLSGERGVVGFLQFQVLREGMLIEAVAASPVLEDLGLGMDAVEALVGHVEVTLSADAGD